MKRLLTGAVLSLLFLSVIATGAQNATSAKKTSAQNANKTRGPIFRATADQVKQAQGILKERGFYGGEKTGKLDDQSREGLRKYQQKNDVTAFRHSLDVLQAKREHIHKICARANYRTERGSAGSISATWLLTRWDRLGATDDV